MDKVTRYQKSIKEVLEQHINFPNALYPDLRSLYIESGDKTHYMVITVGWDGDDYSHNTAFHLELLDNSQVWIHENNTDIVIEEELIEKGIISDDIHIGMIAPYSLDELQSQVA